MGEWTHWIVGTIDGRRIKQMQLSGWDWETRLNGAGSGKCTIPWSATDYDEFTPSIWDELLTPWLRTIVHCYDDVPQYAGILKKEIVDEDAGTSTLETVELRELFGKRYLRGAGTWDPKGKHKFLAKSIRGVLRELLVVVTGGGITGDTSGNSPWGLPVVLPAAMSGTHDREFEHNRFDVADDLIEDLTREDGGPDLYLKPEWGPTGALQYQALIGDPMITGNKIEIDTGAEEKPTSSRGRTINGADMLTGVFTIGEGMDEDLIVEWATPDEIGDANYRMPAMDTAIDYRTEKKRSRLKGLAKGRLRALQRPTVTRSYTLVGYAGQARPGTRLRVRQAATRRFPAEIVDLYVIAAHGDTGHDVRVEVQ